MGQMPEHLKELAHQTWIEAKRIQDSHKVQNPDVVQIGQIWSTKMDCVIPGHDQLLKLTDDMYLVLIVLDDVGAYDPDFPEIRVIPISEKTERAADRDVIISKEQSPLAYELMFECWNEQPMLKANLDQPLGQIDNDVLGDVLAMRRTKSNATGFELVYTKSGLPIIGVNQGVYDMRKDFQAKELEATAYLRQPVMALLAYWEEKD